MVHKVQVKNKIQQKYTKKDGKMFLVPYMKNYYFVLLWWMRKGVYPAVDVYRLRTAPERKTVWQCIFYW